MDSSHIDEIWMQFKASGDLKSFERLYDGLFLSLLQFSVTISRSREVSEELVNDIFLMLWNRRKDLNHVLELRSYLFISVRNRSLDVLRKASKKAVMSLDDIENFHVRLQGDPENLFITSELMTEVERAVAELPPRCQLVFILVRQYGLKYREVASILDISQKTVENQLAIAVQKISTKVQTLFASDISSS